MVLLNRITCARSRIRGAVAAALATGLALGVAGLAYAALTPVAVLTGVPDQIQPAASGSTLAWDRNGPSDSGPYNAYVWPRGAPVKQLNGPGTQAFSPGISGSLVIYQRVTGGQSDLRLYNLTTHAYTAPPTGWNTTQWEFWPKISGNMVLFGREHANQTYSIYLGDLATGQVTLLQNANQGVEQPGQINGNFAVWTLCASRTCHVFRYDIAAHTTTQLPAPTGSLNKYSASVSSTGTVYYVHGGAMCGSSVKLVRYPIGGPDTVLVSFAGGVDVSGTYVDDTSGTPVVYYSRSSCGNGGNHGDIYKVTD